MLTPGLVSGLTYVFDGKGGIKPEHVPGKLQPDPGWLLLKFASGKFCNTDLSNASGAVGHGDLTGQVVGHECCFYVVESKCEGVKPGQFVVLLGDDFRGMAEYSVIKPILPGGEVPPKDLAHEKRGDFFDPKEGHKAVIVLDEWFSGASLIEPATHVYTSLNYNGLGPGVKEEFRKPILVAGAGLCGQIACSFLRAWHPRMEIILMDTDYVRLISAKARGLADKILNPLDGLEEIENQINNSHGARVGAVFDALPAIMTELPGGADSRELAARLVEPKGRWVLYGAAESIRLPLMPILGKGIMLGGAPYDSRVITFGERAGQMREVAELVERGVLKVSGLVNPEPVDFFDEAAVTSLFRKDRSGAFPRVEIRHKRLMQAA